MKKIGDKTDMISPVRLLGSEFLRFHPATAGMKPPIYTATEKVGLIKGQSWGAGTHDGIRDGAGSFGERYEMLVTVYYDEDGLMEAGLSRPGQLPINEVRTCKTHGCPAGFHVCTKY